MSILKVGIIGYNEGNGHPYSFSAIINGFNPDKRNWSRYPQILAYLNGSQNPIDNVAGLKVTHIYTPDIQISQNIAKSSNIENVVIDPKYLLNKVDLVLILTDEGGNHWDLANLFLDNNIQVFIDKPLCNNKKDLSKFIPFLKSNLLFSCSGFIYHQRIKELSKKGIKSNSFTIGKTRLDWFKYGIHLLEPILLLHKSDIKTVTNVKNETDRDIVMIEFENGSYSIIIRDNSTDTFSIDIHTEGFKLEKIIFDNNYLYFASLIEDIKSFGQGNRVLSWTHTSRVIETLINAKK